jgi:uncharacterized protein (TIGR02466 family)
MNRAERRRQERDQKRQDKSEQKQQEAANPDRPASDMTTLFRQAVGYHQHGRLREAEKLYQQILVAHPNHFDTLNNLALVAKASGNPDRAVNMLRRALKANAGSIEAHNNLGVTLHEQNKVDEAITAYREALEINPKSADVHHNLGFALHEQGHLDAAIASYQTSIDLSPNFVDAHINLGIAWKDKGDIAQAETYFQQAVDLDPSSPEARHNLGFAFAEQSRSNDAIRLYREAIGLRESYPEAHNNLGNALKASGQFDDALVEYRVAIQQEPRYAAAHNGLGNALIEASKLNEAEASIREAIRLDPTFALAHVTLANLYMARAKTLHLGEAEAAAREAVKHDPKLAEARRLLSLILLRAEKFDDAAAEATEAVALVPESVGLKVNLADILLKSGRLDEAEAAARAAIELGPEDAEAHYLLGQARFTHGDPAAAVEAYRVCGQDLNYNQTDRLASETIALQTLGRNVEADYLTDFDRLISDSRLENPAPFGSVAEFNESLAAEVLAHPSLEWEPAGYVASGGSLTDNLLTHQSPPIETFERFLRQSIDRYIDELPVDPEHPYLRQVPKSYKLRVWATVLGKEGFIGSHIHRNGWMSGAYYARLPEDVGPDEDEYAGWIQFGPPEWTPDQKTTATTKLIKPEPGRLLLFPAYFYHRTLPLKNFSNRMSVVFDLYPTEWRDNT